jgi:hypothetical protein
MSFLKNAGLGLALALGCMSAHAAIVTTTLNGVVIGTQTYNVIFSEDSDGATTFNDVFGAGAPALTFTTRADAFAAAMVVRDAADAIDMDVTPAGSSINAFRLAFSYTGTDFSSFLGWPDISNGVFGPVDISRTVEAPGSFAVFEPRRLAEPATLSMFALVLGAVGFGPRRKKAP